MDEKPAGDAKVCGRKTRFRVTLPPPAPPTVEGDAPSEPAAASPTVLVEGGVFPRPLTEPVPGAKPGGHRTYFVYADAAEEAKHKARQALRLHAEHPLEVEEAGYVEDGVVHFPPEEEAAVRASMQDGRKAPGA
jgi:hypothetical protein